MTVNHKVLNVALAAITFLVISSFELCFGQVSKAVLDRPRPNVKNIIALLDSGKLEEVPKAFFGGQYNPELPDLIIYMDQDKKVKIKLVQGGKKRNELIGARNLWVMVFAVDDSLRKTIVDTNKVTKIEAGQKGGKTVYDSITTTETKVQKRLLEVYMEPIDHRLAAGEAGLFSLIRSVSTAFGVGVAEPGTPGELQDVTDTIEVRNFGGKEEYCRKLYFGVIKLPLGENTINRIRVKPFGSKYAYATVGNYSASYLAAGIGIGFSRRENGNLLKTRFDGKLVESEIFIFSHIYLMRPQLPSWHSTSHMKCYRRMLSKVGIKSLSLVGGAKISMDHFLDDLFFGIGFGHILGNAGIVAGINFTTLKDGNSQDRYKPEPLAGFYYLL